MSEKSICRRTLPNSIIVIIICHYDPQMLTRFCI